MTAQTKDSDPKPKKKKSEKKVPSKTTVSVEEATEKKPDTADATNVDERAEQKGVYVEDFVMDRIMLIERLYEKKQSVAGVPTGFADLDKLTSGLQPGNLIVVAGRSGAGKAAFCMNIAQHVSMLPMNPIPAGIISLGMSKEEIVMRLLSSESGIDHTKLKTGTFTRDNWPRLAKAGRKLLESKLIIDDTAALPITELLDRARKWKEECDVGLIIIDYLQLIPGQDKELFEIIGLLKALAKELRIPVIAISQLSEKTRGRPQLSDLSDSVAIKRDADVILFVYRGEIYQYQDQYGDDSEETAEVIIGKQRNGPIDSVELRFIGSQMTFRNPRKD